MGSRIAAHFANARIPSLLLDLTVEAARKGIQNAVTQKPGAFFIESGPGFITPGSFDQDLARVDQCDWIIEAVTENLEIKRELWRKVELLCRADAILSTNTSGIPLHRIAEGFSPGFQRRFLGTHFFNPPRYLHLLELIPGPETDPELLRFMAEFASLRLGKGVVPCKDTPNFIGNRIGFFFLGTVAKIAQEDGYTVEEVDALTGALIGLPNSATFRLLDIVGLDVTAFVGENLYEAVPEDPWRDRFRLPEFLREMIGRGWLGEKSGQGFYKRVGPEKQIYALDLKTFEYRPAAKASFPAAEGALNKELGERLRTLVSGAGREATFLWKLFSDYFLYSAACVPEIADRIVEIDRAMRWGYAHKLGPFELWDALGFEEVCARLEAEGRELPPNIRRMRSAGAKSLYGNSGGTYFDFASGGYRPFEAPGLILARHNRVKTNPGASLVDVGDGVLCLEFHSKMNTLGEDQIRMMEAGVAETEKNFAAMIIANQGETFSAGANLALVLFTAQNGDWDELDEMIRRFQQANLALKYSKRPVVAAPFGRALGGACEICLHAAGVQASAETYMGLVETAVGLIPAGGGCKEMLLRESNPQTLLERIGSANVSNSADDAERLGFLRYGDRSTMNPDRLIDEAKRFALDLAPLYKIPVRPQIKVGGAQAFALLKLGLWTWRQGGYISDYDVVVGEKLANVLSGGRLTGEQNVSEQYLLDLEREAFLSLCGNLKTQERMQYTLKAGKPLRN